MTALAAHDLEVQLEASQLDSYPLRRRSHDFYARGLIGPVFYFVAYLLLLSVSDFFARASWWVALPAVLFAGLGWARYQHRVPAAGATKEQFEKWGRRHWVLVHANSFAWGVVPAVVGWLEGKPDSAVLVVSLSTMAFCTAASQAFAMHPGQARLSMLALIIPGVAVFMAPGLDLRPTGVTLFFYSFYLLANLRRSSQEYTRQVDTEVELMRSRTEVTVLSLTDPLTGVANRRHYEVAWDRAAAAAQRQRQPLALLMLDLDHFKKVNDEYGHLGGDACLRHFSDVLRAHFRRDSDFIARLGGEEFVVVLPDTTQARAVELSEQLRLAFAASPCPIDGAVVALTVSIGVAAVDEGMGDPTVTFRHADAACYAAKEAGRNRVVAWTPTLEPRRS